MHLSSERRMMIMARESSIQLTYQNALLLYQVFYPPLVELDFTNGYDGQPITPARDLTRHCVTQ